MVRTPMLERARYPKSLFAEGNVEEYIAKQKYKAKFVELKTNDTRPKQRVQAAFAFDEARQLIYMFGGNDESVELNDFWMFDIQKNEWSEIESLNGPDPRSGAKMVFDPFANQLFVIGRKPSRGNEILKVGEFFSFRKFERFFMVTCFGQCQGNLWRGDNLWMTLGAYQEANFLLNRSLFAMFAMGPGKM